MNPARASRERTIGIHTLAAARSAVDEENGASRRDAVVALDLLARELGFFDITPVMDPAARRHLTSELSRSLGLALRRVAERFGIRRFYAASPVMWESDEHDPDRALDDATYLCLAELRGERRDEYLIGERAISLHHAA
ncbi:MAG: hypothetical protein HY719_10330 [Planctomycetes bacterium]|nr:hypothetical protein [Planctomycetota bacterium]